MPVVGGWRANAQLAGGAVRVIREGIALGLGTVLVGQLATDPQSIGLLIPRWRINDTHGPAAASICAYCSGK
jgi:hypothetical protein